LGKEEVGLAAGYALAIPIGGTAGGDLEDVQFIYFAPRWGVGLGDPVGGDAWYRGNFDFLVEGAFLYEVEPRDGWAAGLTLMFRYNFLPGGNFVPFVEAGAGFVVLDFDLEDQADGVNFTPQAGLGFHYFVSERTAVTGEWRFHHISNAGTEEPNRGINDSLFLVGLTIFLE
jgi:opacity protein-like surface antigen